MFPALRNQPFRPVPPPPGAGEADLNTWGLNAGRALAPHSGVADYKPGPQFPNALIMPFAAQPGPSYRTWFGMNPGQPYRATAGLRMVTVQYPQYRPYHLAGGVQTGGAPVAEALKARMAALLAMRQRLGGVPASRTRRGR